MCGSEEVKVNRIKAGIFVDKGNGSQERQRLETLIILSLLVPCSGEQTVNEAIFSSSAHITRYKLVYWARKNCPFLTFQSDFPCGDQQKEKAVLPDESGALSKPQQLQSPSLLRAALFIAPPGHPICMSCSAHGKGILGIHWRFRGD